MNKKMMIAFGVLVLVGSMYFVFGGIISNVVAEESVQKVTIDMKNGAYSPNITNVEAGIPLRLYLSENVRGCFRDLTLPEMGINKYLADSEDYVEVIFPKGTYTFACSMYMCTGKIIAS